MQAMYSFLYFCQVLCTAYALYLILVLLKCAFKVNIPKYRLTRSEWGRWQLKKADIIENEKIDDVDTGEGDEEDKTDNMEELVLDRTEEIEEWNKEGEVWTNRKYSKVKENTINF